MRGYPSRTVLLVLALTTRAFGQSAPSSKPRALAFTHVTVIDATGSPAQPNMTVVIAGGRIAAIGSSADVTIPESVEVVDATGKFLIPGLVDMHVHTTSDQYFIEPLMLANGVTGVREMYAQNLSAIQARRKALADGTLLGPRIFSAGPIVDGLGAPWPGSIVVTNAAEASAAVDKIKREGFDYVKVYSGLGRDAYFAVADEAKKDGIPYAGHLPDAISAMEGSNAGQKSFEHLYGISLACSTREEGLRTALAHPTKKANEGDPRRAYFAEQKAELDTFNEEKAAALFAVFRRNGTWQVPTLVVMRNAALIYDPEYVQTLPKSSRLRYVPHALKMMWNLALRFSGQPLPPEDLATSRRYFNWELNTVGEMQKAGVGILAGTDTPNPFVYPGFGLHDELGLLVQAGLTPMEALQAATRNPARFLGTLEAMGTIETGKVADLDLLDANPLEDIRNTQSLNAVVLGGRLIPRAGLDALLAQAEDNRWRANPAALTLMGLVLHMMRNGLYVALATLLGISGSLYYLLKRRRRRKVATSTP